jgi:hypothetical protein
MAHTKQVKAAATLNNAFDSNFTGGDGKELCATDHPLAGGGTFRNEPSTAADLNETSLENALIDISTFVDERNMIIALRGTKLIIPPQLQFVADRLLESTLRVGTADNDVNAIRNMGMLPEGYTQMRSSLRLTHLTASSILSVHQCAQTWKRISTQATCALRLVSVIASAILTHAQYSVHPERNLCYNRAEHYSCFAPYFRGGF